MKQRTSVALVAFAFVFSCFGMARIHTVALASDGWERGEVARLARQVDIESARQMALETIIKLSDVPPGRETTFGITGPRLREAQLGEPYFCYWAGDEFAEYEFADPSALLEFMIGFIIEFPVVADSDVLGTIGISKNRLTGQLEFTSGALGTNLYDRVSKIRQRHPSSSVSLVGTGMAGQYFLLNDAPERWRLSPANPYAARVIGLAADDNMELNFFSLEHVSKSIKDKLERLRRSTHETPKRN